MSDENNPFDIVFHPQAGGMTTTEVAKVLGMNRVTVSTWKNGHCRPHFLHRARIEMFLRAVRKAVRNKALPVDEVKNGDARPLLRTERLRQIMRVLETHGFTQ